MLNTYSYGVDCVWKVQCTDEQAAGFNKFNREFEKAQIIHKQMFGRPWTADDYLMMYVTEDEERAYSEVAVLLNEALAFIDQDATPIVMTEDHLVKN